jgi:hypothetical protein
MKKAYLFTLYLAIGSIFSCTYEPVETYFRTITPPQQSYSINLTNIAETDTLWVYDQQTFTYKLDSRYGRIDSTQIWYDNYIISSYTGSSDGTFRLSYNNLSTGPHSLKIEFKVSSGSGSLADKVGAENFKVWRKWVVMVDVDGPPSPNLTLSNVNGFVQLKWNKYTKPNFRYYQLEYPSSSGTATKYIYDQNQTTLVDSAFAGTSRDRYALTTSNTFGAKTTSASTGFDCNFTMVYNFADSTFSITWRKPPYEGPLESYTVSEQSGYLKSVVHVTTTNHSDTTFNFKVAYPFYNASTEIVFKMTGKNGKALLFGSQRIDKLVQANTLKRSSTYLVYNADLKSIFGIGGATGNRYIYRYDDKQQLTDSIKSPGSFSVPFQGKYGYYTDAPNLVQVDLETHQTTMFNIKTTLAESGPSNISASSSGKVAFGCFSNIIRPVTAYYRVYDFQSNTIRNEWSRVIDSNTQNQMLSYTGKYLVVNHKTVSKWDGSAYQHMYDFVPDILAFKSDDEDKVLIRTQSGIDIFDLNSLTTVKSVICPFDPNNYFGKFNCYAAVYDPVTQDVIFHCKDGVFYIVNLNTGAVQKTFIEIDYEGTAMAFINGVLYLWDGKYLKLK